MDESVKEKFQKLIDYQKKDTELRKLVALIERDDALAGMNKYKKAFNDAKQTLADCEDTSSALISGYAELERYVADNEALLAELEAAEAASEEELAERVKKLESLKSKFQSAEKKARDIDDKSKEVYRDRAEAVKAGNMAKQMYTECKAKHGGLVDSKAAEINALKAQLAEMREGLDANMYEEYCKLVAERMFPPVVMALGDEKKEKYYCGCGIELSQQANTLLKDKGWCRCDNCRRFIVKLK